jgi:hypothetical protein
MATLESDCFRPLVQEILFVVCYEKDNGHTHYHPF